MKCQSVFNVLHETGGDICLLQECALPFMDNYTKFAKRWTYGQSFWSGDNQNRMSGVGFLINDKTINIENVEVVVDGRALCIDVDKNGSKFRIINVYGHTELKERTALFQILQPFLCNRRQIILGGDFNCAPETSGIQGAVSTVKKDSSTCALDNLIKDGNLTDVFRFLNPSDPGYTWSNKKSLSRIDFLFASKGLIPLSCKVEPVPFSDHHKVMCRFSIQTSFQPAPGPWKLNLNLLKDGKVTGRYKLKLQQWVSLQPLYESVGEWWESIKIRTQAFFSFEGKMRAKRRRQWLLRKQAKLQRFYNLLNLGFDVSEEIMNLKKEMMVVLNEKSKGVLIRSRVKHVEENEKCTRYFF